MNNYIRVRHKKNVQNCFGLQTVCVWLTLILLLSKQKYVIGQQRKMKRSRNNFKPQFCLSKYNKKLYVPMTVMKKVHKAN